MYKSPSKGFWFKFLDGERCFYFNTRAAVVLFIIAAALTIFRSEIVHWVANHYGAIHATPAQKQLLPQ